MRARPLPPFVWVLGLLTLTLPALVAQPTISLTQPTGPGSCQYTVAGAPAGAELFNLANFTPHTPTGGGPIFGLGVAGSEGLLSQILAPLGTAPHHVSADGAGAYSWSYNQGPLGILVPVDVVCVVFGPTGYVSHSTTATAILDM